MKLRFYGAIRACLASPRAGGSLAIILALGVSMGGTVAIGVHLPWSSAISSAVFSFDDLRVVGVDLSTTTGSKSFLQQMTEAIVARVLAPVGRW